MFVRNVRRISSVCITRPEAASGYRPGTRQIGLLGVNGRICGLRYLAGLAEAVVLSSFKILLVSQTASQREGQSRTTATVSRGKPEQRK